MQKLVVLALFVLPFVVKAQAKLTAFRNTVENGYNFWLYEPKDDTLADEPEKKPLIIFLHGKSLFGNNLYQVKKYGTINAIEMGRQIDAYVLSPQTNNGWNPERILNIMNWTIENYDVDTNRVYVLGMSMGGYGTIDFVGTYPDKIAAAMAFCGGGTLKDYCGLNEVPLWIIHGTADRAVGIEQSDRVVEAMNSCGETNRLIYERWKGVNHSILARLFYLPATYEWLFKHSLKDEDRTVNKDVVINKSSLNVAYKNLTPHADE